MNTHIINSNKHGRLKYSFLEMLRIIWKNPRQVDWSWSWLPFTNMDIRYFYSFFTDTNFRYHGFLLNKKIIQLINFSLHSSKISIYIKTKKHLYITKNLAFYPFSILLYLCNSVLLYKESTNRISVISQEIIDFEYMNMFIIYWLLHIININCQVYLLC